MSITVVFDPPLPSDNPATFDRKAFTLLGDLNTWSGQANQVAGGINADKTALLNAGLSTVAGSIANVNAVGTNIAAVATVAADLNEPVSEIETVAGSIANVNAVGTNIANVNTVAGISSNVSTVAGISTNVTTVAGAASNVNTVAGISANVTTVGTNIASVNTAAANIVAIQNAATNASNAAASAAAAATSASDAAASASSASTSAANAATSAAASAAYASMAQATNPDTPIRLNPRFITADFTVPAAYNGASVGPISISDGVTVTIQDHATWSIH